MRPKCTRIYVLDFSEREGGGSKGTYDEQNGDDFRASTPLVLTRCRSLYNYLVPLNPYPDLARSYAPSQFLSAIIFAQELQSLTIQYGHLQTRWKQLEFANFFFVLFCFVLFCLFVCLHCILYCYLFLKSFIVTVFKNILMYLYFVYFQYYSSEKFVSKVVDLNFDIFFQSVVDLLLCLCGEMRPQSRMYSPIRFEIMTF